MMFRALILLGIGLFVFFTIDLLDTKKENKPIELKFSKQQTQQKPNMKLGKELGMVKAVKLKHNTTWNMAWDEKYIYVVTYKDKKSFIEKYDKKSLKFIKQNGIEIDHDSLAPIGVDEKYIYVGGDKLTYIYDKDTLESTRVGSGYNALDNSAKVDGIRMYKNYMINYGEENVFRIYKNAEIKTWINQKANYPSNIEQIKDYWDYNRINDVIVHKDKLYTANNRGFVNIYDINTEKFLKQINTIKFEDEWGYVIGTNIQDMAVYQDRYIYFARDYEGVMILDTKTDEISYIKTLFPKRMEYSELLKENVDMTKDTKAHQIVFYKDNLIFSEVNARENFVYVYNLKQKKIIHTFKGHSDDITEMFVDRHRLIGLSYDGYLYEWDLTILDKYTKAFIKPKKDYKTIPDIEYKWIEVKGGNTKFCKNEDGDSLYKFLPQYKGKINYNHARIVQVCKEDSKTPIDGYYMGYYKNGKLMFKYPYKNGFKHGIGKQYHKNGKLEFEGEYIDGVPVGDHKWYWVDNKHKLKKTTYKDGIQHKYFIHRSDGRTRYVDFDENGHFLKGKDYDKYGVRDCGDDKHILKVKDYECLADRYSLGKKLESIDNNVSTKAIDDLISASNKVAPTFDEYADEFYKGKQINPTQKAFLEALIKVAVKEQFEKVVENIITNQRLDKIIYELMAYEMKRKAVNLKDEKYDEVVKLLSVSLEYKGLHKEKELILFPNKMVKDETMYGKKLYKEIQYRYVEFLKSLGDIK